MKTRKNEFSIIKDEGVSVIIMSLPSGANFDVIYQTIIARWEEIKKLCKKYKTPFALRVKMRGETEVL